MEKTQQVKKAVILAAGYGTRFLPFSKSVSKTLLPIVDTPAIQKIVEEATLSGIEEILIIVGFNKDIIISHFTKNEHLEEVLKNKPEFLELAKKPTEYKISFVEQKVLDGTAGAVNLAKNFTKDEPFLLMFGDDLMYSDGKPVSKQIIDEYYKTGKCVLGCQNVTREQATKYGVVEFSGHNGRSYNMTKMTEKPKLEEVKSTLVNLGRYVITPNFFDYIEKIKPGKNGERYTTDVFDLICRDHGVIAYDFEGLRFDLGSKAGYLKACIHFGLLHPETKNELKEYLKEIKY